MMPWNRKEIWMGSDEQFFLKLKKALSSCQVKCASDRKNGYYVYVHKYDYEKARHALQKMNR
ncbi:MAG: hypothetical protein VB081_08315 [Christensenella sp.]|uniref:hypothetical protein n=1 Tax=Christensenella sp. TaxID=1935934 RepID=UPI002B20D752|nr:hypothetical protein [Christensenella sp.]MEA5003487.1 hypothetical protein [Christensenella sp.]